MRKYGFTLIELLIVVAIIAILAVVAFVALNPLQRFQDARNATRWSDVNGVLEAIKIDQLDNGGNYLAAVTVLTPGTNYMIVPPDQTCAAAVTCTALGADINCVDLDGAGDTTTGLVDEGYLGSIPLDPNLATTSTTTGYYINRSSTNTITVGACGAEDSTTIRVSR